VNNWAPFLLDRVAEKYKDNRQRSQKYSSDVIHTIWRNRHGVEIGIRQANC
jgi:hypothetical protein